MIEFILALVVGALALAWSEVKEWLPWIAKRIVRKAVRALPESQQERMEEELLAEVGAIPGKLSPVIFASSLWWSFWKRAAFVRLDVFAATVAQRIADIVIATCMLVLVFPLFILLFAVALPAAPRPPFIVRRFRDQRGKPFSLLVFRLGRRSDGSYPWWGQLLGVAQELPNLLVVLKGDASLVGPPPLTEWPADYSLGDLKPGLYWVRQVGEHGFGVTMTRTMRLYFVIFIEACRRNAGRNTAWLLSLRRRR